MTCVAGIIGKTGDVTFGSDRRVTIGQSYYEKKDPKIWLVEKHDLRWVFGAAGNQDFIHIVRHVVELPESPPGEMDIIHYLTRHWIPSVIETVHSRLGTVTKNGKEQTESSLLIGVRGQIYMVDSCFAVDASTDSFRTIGSGGAVAQGILAYLEEQESVLSSQERLEAALRISARYNPGVGDRFDFLST